MMTVTERHNLLFIDVLDYLLLAASVTLHQLQLVDCSDWIPSASLAHMKKQSSDKILSQNSLIQAISMDLLNEKKICSFLNAT